MDSEILFVGNFLSAKMGTRNIAVRLIPALERSGIKARVVSRKSNQVLRLIDILLTIITSREKVVNIDVFSGLAFRIVEFGLPFALLRRKRVILTLRGGALIEFTKTRRKRVFRQLRRADLIHTPSLFLKSYFSSQGFEVTYLPNPIDPISFQFNRSNVKAFSILWVRAFAEIYNPEIPIRVVEFLKDIFPSVQLTMIGPDKGLLTKCKTLVKELQVEDKVVFQGPVANSMLHRYYQSHAVYMNTTSYESFGNAMIEAASCGIPIVSSNVGEIPYLWKSGQEILTVEEIKSEHYCTSISKLFNDLELAESLSQRACHRSKMFAMDRIAPQWISTINELSSRS